MQIVIDIPKEVKNRLCFGVTYSKDIQVVCEALNDGTPLPKGHGDLVDFDKLCEEYWDGNYLEIHRDELASIQPIIEADKAGSED